MTEHDWHTSTDAGAMMRYLELRVADRGDLPTMLFAACARVVPAFVGMLGHLPGHKPGRPATVEDLEDLRELSISVELMWQEGSNSRCLADALEAHPHSAWPGRIREIWGNPFTAASATAWWRAAHWAAGPRSTIQEVAQRIYTDRAWEDMPVLADLLEEAGCTDEEILMHARRRRWCPGCSIKGGEYGGGGGWCPVCDQASCEPTYISIPPHTRGCWLLDLILGKRGKDGGI